MKRKYLIISFYCIYIAFLFIVAIAYTITTESVTGFGAGLATDLMLTYKYLVISFLGSSAFLIVAYSIHKKLSLLFTLFAPFLNVVVSVVVAFVVAFLLWITQLQKAVNIFEEIFFIATTSTSVTTLWLLNDMFRVKSKSGILQ